MNLQNIKTTLNLIEKMAEGGKIRGKCQCYKEGEKSTTSF